MNVRKYVLATLFLLISAFSFAQTQNDPFYFIGDVYAGKEATVVYNSNKTILKNEKKVEAIVYFWQNYKWTAHDIDMVKTDSLWTAKIAIPEGVALLDFKFYAGNTIDRGSVYGYLTLDEKKMNLPSAYTGWGLLRGEYSQQYGIPDLIKDSTQYIKDEVLLFWFNQELRYHPNERKNIYKYALEVQSRVDPAKCKEQTLREVDFVLKGDPNAVVPEQTYIDCIKALQRIKNDSLANALKDEALKKYPDGILARDIVIWNLFRESNPKTKQDGLASLLERFPTSKFADIRTETSDLYYAKIMQSVIYNEIITNNNYDLLYKYIGDTPYLFLETAFWHMVQIPYRNNERTAAQLLPYANLIMNEIVNRPRLESQLIYSSKEWLSMRLNRTKEAIMAYARILDETGDTAKGMALLDSIKPYYNSKSADFNNIYTQMLIKTNRAGEVMAVIKNGIKENAASPEMIELLKQDYIKTTGSEKDFESYMNGLKSSDLLTKQQEKLRKEMVNLPIKLFEVERLSGEKVDMAKMKGKIIIIDFWATWCAPCIAAMPGMQMAVNKYKGDENVAFFFLSTQESNPKYKDRIKALMQQKGYSFDVVLDSPSGNDTADLVYSTYAKEFKFSGIPQKMIIDGKGRLRWRSTGYFGSPSELADEISYIIELLKSEGNK